MRYILPYVLVLLAMAACSSPPSEDVVLARVDGDVITAREFQLNYEFGHGHLRQGDHPRDAYLRFMIFELLLAQEAEKIHLDTAAAIVHAMHTLREELLIERVFEERVLSGIEVTAEEIATAINKDAVRFQFRFLPARTEEEAAQLRAVVQAQGFEAALAANADLFSELNVEPASPESPPVAAEDLEPDILQILQDLPLHQVSEPVQFRGWWYLFEVTSIQRQPIAPEDYTQKASTYRKIVYNRKALEGATSFISSLMEPLNVVTKREGFSLLAEALWAWYKIETPKRNLLHYIESQGLDTEFTRALVASYDTPLVTFEDELWTIRGFLEHFTPGRYILRARDRVTFEGQLANTIALVVRDAILLEIAEKGQFNRNDSFRRTLVLWKKKWLFQEIRGVLLDSTAITDADIAKYYALKNRELQGRLYPYERLSSGDRRRIRAQMMRDQLFHYADSLALGARIEINQTVLDTLSFSHSRVNPQMTVHLLKSNSNKMPFPIADPNWRTPSTQ